MPPSPPWDEVADVLMRLRVRQPEALLAYPAPDDTPGTRLDRKPPFHIRLAAWAIEAAEELHRRFGEDVDLVVGALRYPQRIPERQPWTPTAVSDLDRSQIDLALDGPVLVRCGRTVRHALIVSNLSDCDLTILTNGQLTATIVDPNSGRDLGGFAGAQTLPLVVFPVPAGTAQRSDARRDRQFHPPSLAT